jgi:hypothetical protein
MQGSCRHLELLYAYGLQPTLRTPHRDQVADAGADAVAQATVCCKLLDARPALCVRGLNAAAGGGVQYDRRMDGPR